MADYVVLLTRLIRHTLPVYDFTFAIMNDQNVSVELANFQKLLNLPATADL